MLKDSVPCPIPNAEKDTPARPFSEHDITQARTRRNRDRLFHTEGGALSCRSVAEWPRFRHAGNHSLKFEASKALAGREIRAKRRLALIREGFVSRGGISLAELVVAHACIAAVASGLRRARHQLRHPASIPSAHRLDREADGTLPLNYTYWRSLAAPAGHVFVRFAMRPLSPRKRNASHFYLRHPRPSPSRAKGASRGSRLEHRGRPLTMQTRASIAPPPFLRHGSSSSAPLRLPKDDEVENTDSPLLLPWMKKQGGYQSANRQCRCSSRLQYIDHKPE